jgi:L-aminopeptidase/D-esterase-like protein
MFQQSTQADTPIGFSIGHWTNDDDRTGCTVVLFDRPAPAVADVRGGAPGTRETSLLGPGDLVQAVDAILLTGGSAFGLAAADGVMRFLSERGRGVTTPAGPVPIVPAAVLFDLAVGNPTWPDADAGYAAASTAQSFDRVARGAVGAGRGATTDKLLPNRGAIAGGFGIGRCDIGDGAVYAISAVNAAGFVQTGLAGDDSRPAALDRQPPPLGRTSTTLTVVLVDAPCDYRTLTRVAIAAHDGMARKIVPCHTIFDGDIVFAVGMRLAHETPPPQILTIGIAAELAVERAIVDAVQSRTAEGTIH